MLKLSREFAERETERENGLDQIMFVFALVFC